MFDQRCRYVGHTLNNQYGEGSGSIGLADIQCVGTESSLFDCPHNAVWGDTGCTHAEDVSISCIAGSKNTL